MEKDRNIMKVTTHADGREEYLDNAMKYVSNENSVTVKGYGIDENNPENAKMQFENTAKYYGNEDKNQLIQYIMSFTKETADNPQTAMEITEKVLEPFKEEHQILIGVHKKEHDCSDYHTHSFVGTTNLETGKMIHSTNRVNYPIAQNFADITGEPIMLIIENIINCDDGKKKDFERWFYPRKEKTD